MGRIRVLAIEDSALARRVLKESLQAAGDVDVVAVVGSTSLGLARSADGAPDVIVLDLFVVDESWEDSLAKLRAAHPAARVLGVAPNTSEGVRGLQRALSNGANQTLERPESDRDLVREQSSFAERLVAKVRAAAEGRPAEVRPSEARPSENRTADAPKRDMRATAVQARAPLPVRRPPRVPTRIDCLAIGCSTGGPNALMQVLGSLPGDFPVPIVLVQHMPPIFTANMAQNLTARIALQAREAVAGDELRPGLVLIAPGDHHMVVDRRGCIGIHQGPAENFCRPAVDVLFRSVAESYGPACLTLVLTGMGQDGLLGAQSIAAAGGTILVQDEASSVVWGMPGAIARAGLADKVLPLDQIAHELNWRARELRGLPRGTGEAR